MKSTCVVVLDLSTLYCMNLTAMTEIGVKKIVANVLYRYDTVSYNSV